MQLSLRPPKLVRGTAFLTLLCFLSTSVFAAPVPILNSREAAAKEAANPFDLLTAQLPAELGRIQETHEASSEKLIVLIQNAHSIPAAQKSLEGLTEYFLEHYGIRQVALEGTSEEIDATVLKNFPDKEELRKVFGSYLDRGEISGAAAAAFLAPQHAHYFGIESQALYEEGVELFLAALNEEEALLKQLAPRRAEIEKKKKRLYPGLAYQLDQKWNAVQEKNQAFLPFLSFLQKLQIKEKNLALHAQTFPHLFAVLEQIKHQAAQDPGLRKKLAKIENELNRAPKDKETAHRFNEIRQNYRTEKLSGLNAAQGYLEIARTLGLAGVEKQIREWPELNTAALNLSLETIQGDVLWKEITAYLSQIKNQLLTNPAAKALDAESETLLHAEKLARLELTREEWEKWKAGSEESFISQEAFYRNALARESAMLEQWEIKSKDAGASLLVAGGFHAEGFRRALREKGISYVVVAPTISDIPENNSYREFMRGNVSWRHYFEVKNGRIDLYEAFTRATRDRLSANSRLLKEWRDRILLDLAEQKKLSRAESYTKFIDENFEDHSEKREAGRKAWLEKFDQFAGGLKALDQKHQLTPENIVKLATNEVWNAIPAGTMPARFNVTPQTVSVSATRRDRSEHRAAKRVDYADLKGLNRVKNSTIISLQMEMGYSRGFLQAIEDEYGKQIADQVSQASLTGGLGALMHDLFPSWQANELDIIGIHPIWDEIKKKPYPEGPLHLGKYQRDLMRKQMQERGEQTMKFDVELPWDKDYHEYAQGNEKARNAYGRKIRFEVFKEYTSQYEAPQYHLYAYYLKDEKAEDTEENQISIFDTVYSDDHPAWRDLHMTVFVRGAEKLIKLLQAAGKIKPQTVEIHNEVFVSLPKAEDDPNRTMVHINHSAYQPTIYSPSVKSFGLFGFKPWMRPYVLKDNGQAINLVDYAALAYDALTGVAIDEHYEVLRRNIFRNAGSRLTYYNDGRIRSTNGVLTEHWQAESLQILIDQYRIQLDLPETVDSKEFYEALDANIHLREEFITRQEFIKAAEAGFFLTWMADIQGQPAWLEKALAESGKTKEDLQNFRNDVLRAARSHDPAEWAEILLSHSALRDVLLSRPMSSNVRRQVPYKGPEKWNELLEGLRNSPERLAAFKATKVRQIIGGRTFSEGADQDFQKMKALVNELGLQDHFAFIENYNINDAAIMFQAMAAVVMLSDEFLEASATSMMKVVVNGGAVIGAWAGAMPELFEIVDENGQIIDIFKKKTPHNLVVRNLKNGRWKITNGYLVRYSDEISKQAGGGRRPDAEFLLQSLFWLNEQYADSQKRRDLMWRSLVGTSKVDMREGQARAHMHLIEQVLAQKETDQKIIGGLRPSIADIEKIVDPQAPRFVWRKNTNQVFKEGEQNPAGLLGLVEMFREITTYGAGEERGKQAIESVRHHALHGDIFQFILGQLSRVSGTNFKSLLDELKAMETSANGLRETLRLTAEDPELEHERKVNLEHLTNLNIRAIELVEKMGLKIAEQVFNEYLSSQDVTRWNKKVLPNVFLRRFLARYLENRPDIVTLDNQNALIKVFGFMHNGEPKIFPVDIGSLVTIDEANKARGGDIVYSAALKRFVTQFIPDFEQRVLQSEHTIVQMVNEKNGEQYGYYDLANTKSKISLGIPSPQGVQLLGFQISTGPAANLMISEERAVLDAQHLLDFVKEIRAKASTQDVQQSESGRGTLKVEEKISQEKMDALLEPLALLDKDTAVSRFGVYLPRMMALIAGLSPKHLDSIKKWEPYVYTALKRTLVENEILFREGEIHFHETNLQTSVEFSRSINGGDVGENVIFPIQFSTGPVNRPDGKVWFIVSELGDANNPVTLVPENDYEVRSLLNGITFARVRKGSELMKDWANGVPVEDRYARGEKIRHGWGFDIYQIRSVTPRPDKVPYYSVQPPVEHTIPNLVLAENMPDLGARYDMSSGTVSTAGALHNLSALVPAIHDAGIGSVYQVGRTEKGGISYDLHQVDHAGLHFLMEPKTGLPRVVVSINGYPTKRRDNLRDNQGNPFSVLDLKTVDARFSSQVTAAGINPGTVEASNALSKSVNAEMDQMGIRNITDFMLWRAPESINETNYRKYFYRELNHEEQQDWQSLPNDEERAKFMKQKARDGGEYAVRLHEGGVDRIILVKHMFNEPGKDQTVLNIFHPEVMADLKQDIEGMIDDGFTGIRIDLAHKLLNFELKNMYDAWKGWGTAEFQPDAEPLKELIDHARAYAASKDRSIFIIAEAYMPYHHDPLIALGVDAVYFENFHKDFFRLAAGDSRITARSFGDMIEYAAKHKNLYLFPANYDVEPLKNARGHREAFLLSLIALARLGTPVMIGGRELLDQTGELIPVPGGEHPFSEYDDILRRRDFPHYEWQFRQSPHLQLIKKFLNTLDGRKMTDLKILDNENRDQFISIRLEFETGTPLLVVLNFKPKEDQIIWSEWEKDAGELMDVVTGETFSFEDGKVNGLVFPSMIQYRILAPKVTVAAPAKDGRSEQRTFSEVKAGGMVGGLVSPMIQVRSEKDAGIIDFELMKRQVDINEKLGFRVSQHLPFNFSSTPPAPYSVGSSRVLDPKYISIDAALEMFRGQLSPNTLAFVERHAAEMERLRKLKDIDHSAVTDLKMKAFREIWTDLQSQDIPGFITFKLENQDWLTDHLLFLELRKEAIQRDPARGWDFRTWHPNIRKRDENSFEMQDARARHAREIEFQSFVQFLADHQLTDLVQYGEERGVDFMIDIPFALDGADIWLNPNVFSLKSVNDYIRLVTQGVPPEESNPDGQYWQFFPYDWTNAETIPFLLKMFAHYQKRSRYIRLDHGLGFYRAFLYTEDTNLEMTLGKLGIFEEIENLRFRAAAEKTEAAKQAAVEQVWKLIIDKLSALRKARREGQVDSLTPELQAILNNVLPIESLERLMDETGKLYDDNLIAVAREVKEEHPEYVVSHGGKTIVFLKNETGALPQKWQHGVQVSKAEGQRFIQTIKDDPQFSDFFKYAPDWMLDEQKNLRDGAQILEAKSTAPEHWKQEYVVEKKGKENFLRLSKSKQLEKLPIGKGFLYNYLFPEGNVAPPQPTDSLRLGYFQPATGEKMMSEFVRLAQEQGTVLILELLGTVPPAIQASVDRLAGVYQYVPVIWGLKPTDTYYPVASHAYRTFSLHDSVGIKGRWEKELSGEDRKVLLDSWFGPGNYNDQDFRTVTDRVRDKIFEMVFAPWRHSDNPNKVSMAFANWNDILRLGDDYRINSPGQQTGQWVARLPEIFTVENILRAIDGEPSAPEEVIWAVNFLRHVHAMQTGADGGVKAADPAEGQLFKRSDPDLGWEVMQIREMDPAHPENAHPFLIDAYVDERAVQVLVSILNDIGDVTRVLMRRQETQNGVSKWTAEWKASPGDLEFDNYRQFAFSFEIQMARDGAVTKTPSGRLMLVKSTENASPYQLNPVAPDYLFTSLQQLHSEMREVVTAFAAGRFGKTEAQTLVEAAQRFSLPRVLFAAEEEAKSPAAMRAYFDRENIRGADSPELFASYRVGKFIEANPDFNVQIGERLQQSKEKMIQDANEYLAQNPKGSLNYAAAFSLELIDTLDGDEKIEQTLTRLLTYVEAVQEIKALHPRASIKGNLQFLMRSTQMKNERVREFARRIDGSGVAKRIEMDQKDGTGILEIFLRENKNALVYGADGSQLKLNDAELQLRLVTSQIPFDLALPIAGDLTSRLALDEFQITAETIDQLPDYLPGVFVWNGSSLEITVQALTSYYESAQAFAASA